MYYLDSFCCFLFAVVVFNYNVAFFYCFGHYAINWVISFCVCNHHLLGIIIIISILLVYCSADNNIIIITFPG